MRAVIDGEGICDREMLHEVLARELGLPPWYGRNLDALHDCLTGPREDTEIRILHPDALRQALGGYADALLAVLRDAAAESAALRLTFGEDGGAPEDRDGPPDP